MPKFFKSFYNWFVIALTALVSLPIIAPILLKLNLILPAKIIYFVYSFFCHQFDYRSIHLFDFQFAWCARDTGIWIGIWIIALLVKFKRIKGIKWYWILPFIIPIALDGGIQTIATMLNIGVDGNLIGMPLYMSNNLARFITGAIFGIGLSLWLSALLISEEKNTENISIANDSEVIPRSPQSPLNSLFKTNFAKVVLIIGLMIPVYLGLVALWNVTSVQNDPIGIADNVPRTPSGSFFERRLHAICPTSGAEDFINLECFLKL